MPAPWNAGDYIEADEIVDETYEAESDDGENLLNDLDLGVFNVSGMSLNPFDYLASGLQGALGAMANKAGGDIDRGAEEAKRALQQFQAQQAVAKAKEEDREQKRQLRLEGIRRAREKANDIWGKLRDNAVPVGIGLGGVILVVNLFGKR